MLGAIAGDIIGSVYEGKRAWRDLRTTDFEPLFHRQARFTDDTVLTVAVADSLLTGADLTERLKTYARAYPGAGYGARFYQWFASDEIEPYGSWGNGSAMRVSPVGFAFDVLDEVRLRAKWTAEVTHDHPEAIRGAQATASAIALARAGRDKAEIRDHVEQRFGYDLSPRLDDIRPGFRFDVSCRGTVPPALIAFLESDDFEHAVRLAISLGGDCDTLACITGGVAQAYYGGVPPTIREEVWARLDDPLREVVERFEQQYGTA